MRIVRAVAWVVGSMVVIPGGIFKGYELFFKGEGPQPQYVCRMITTGPQREALNTTYLAELMQLSADNPTFFKQFDKEEAERAVLASPVVKGCFVKTIRPDTVYIDYTVRKPVALVYDFENMAIDEEGVTFPVTPFFSPKKLPEIYLGVRNIRWGERLEGDKIELALKFLRVMTKNSLDPKRLDVSKAFAASLGKREVVVVLEEGGFSKFLRLTPKNFSQEIGNYLELCKGLSPQSQIIDLRIPQLAFIENNQQN